MLRSMLMTGVDLDAVRTKADALFELFASEVAARCPEFDLLTPRDADKRGTQVSLRHAEGYAIMQALIARGVIGDFRQPDIMRFGLTPLYLRFEDVFRAAEILARGDGDARVGPAGVQAQGEGGVTTTVPMTRFTFSRKRLELVRRDVVHVVEREVGRRQPAAEGDPAPASWPCGAADRPSRRCASGRRHRR